MYITLPSSVDSHTLVKEMRTIEESMLRAARAEQMARRQAWTARLFLCVGFPLGILLLLAGADLWLQSSSWLRWGVGLLLLIVLYVLRDAWERFRGAQARLAEIRALLADLHARLRALRAHQHIG